MIRFASFMPGRFGCSVWLATYAVEMTPSTFAPLFSAASSKIRFAETLFTKVCGLQPISVRATSDWMVAVGVAKIANVSAPAARSLTT